MNRGVPPIFDTITLNEVIGLLFNRKGEMNPCTITAISADLTRNKGGEILTLTDMIVPTADRVKGIPEVYSPKFSKNPSHTQHGTINLFNVNNKRITKVHIDLIVKYNGKTVL